VQVPDVVDLRHYSGRENFGSEAAAALVRRSGGLAENVAMLLRCFSFVALLTVGSNAAYSEAQRLGPLDLVARINGVDIPFGARGLANVTSQGGQFNLDGEITVFASPEIFKERVSQVVEGLLPYRIATKQCTVRLLKLSSLDIVIQDFEARISATASLSLACGDFVNQKRDVPVNLALAPTLKDKESLGWKVLREPEIALPFTWWAAIEMGGADPQKEFKAAVENFLDAKAVVKIPSIEGLDAAFKGANFDSKTQSNAKGANPGGASEISLRVKGDAHISGASATKIISQFLKPPELDVSFALPQSP
jgi:hypothetical protein